MRARMAEPRTEAETYWREKTESPTIVGYVLALTLVLLVSAIV